MTSRPAVKSKSDTRPVNLRMRNDTRALIDRAAELRGKNRSEFMIDAAVAAAQDALLDQTLILVDEDTFAQYLEILDRPPPAEGLERLMRVRAPWLE